MNEAKGRTADRTVYDNIADTRRQQYETLEKMMINKDAEQLRDALIERTVFIQEQGSLIDQLVKECRELIGA